MMLITIRPVQESDIPSIAAIRAQRWQTEAFWIDRINRYLRGEHSPQKALFTRAAFVAVHEGKLAGFVAGHRTLRFDCEGELQWIDVREENRGRGIGYKLIARIGAWFVEHNVTRVCVNVDPSNTPARNLYTRCGAEPFNEHWMIWKNARNMTSPRAAV
jgi:GNAT superfamily N-acetyltransferase